LADECLLEIHRLAAKLESRPEATPPPPAKQGKQPGEAVRTLLFQKFGVDVTAADGVNTHVGDTFLTEVGPNLSRFASPENFASWLGLYPHHKVSGKRKLSVSARPVANRLATALRLAAQSLNRVESPLGDWFRRMRAKLGPAGTVNGRRPQAGAFPLHHDHNAPRFRSLRAGQPGVGPPAQRTLPAQASGPTRFLPPASRCQRCCLEIMGNMQQKCENAGRGYRSKKGCFAIGGLPISPAGFFRVMSSNSSEGTAKEQITPRNGTVLM
jgi:hypothetical protein